MNADWFEKPDLKITEKEKIVYMKVFIDRKAADYLYPWLEYQEKIDKNPSVDKVFTYLQNGFDDLD